jgi:predicted amidohydrolase
MNAGTFKAAMIQMRSGLTPAANIDDAARLIGEAKSASAGYVLTPEMTNILAAKREQLFAANWRASLEFIFISARLRSSFRMTGRLTARS